MKKTLLSCAAVVLASMTASAQLYDQSANGGTSGIISADLTDVGSLVQSADDFEVPAGKGWMVNEVTVSGFRTTADGRNMTKMTVQIYRDDLGPTGTPILNEVITLDSTGVPTPADTVLTLSVTDTWLPEGIYWLSVYGETPQAERWNWRVTSGAAIDQEAVLIDYDDVFGVGATDWTKFSDIGLTFYNLLFIIDGSESSVGIKELDASRVSVFPIPANDVINVTVENAKIEQLYIFDAAGKMVMSERNPATQLNISNLTEGTYLIQMNTTEGITSKQFVK